MESSSFLSLSSSSIEQEDKCFICNKTFRRKDKVHCFGVNDLPKFKGQAEKWSKLKIHKDNNEYVYTWVHRKLNDAEEPLEKSHRSCNRELDLRYMNCAKIWTKNDKFLSAIFLGYLL